MSEITEIDMDEYIVIKNEDLKYLEDGNKLGLFGAIATINYGRRLDGKKDNKYLVLNLDDEIDLDFLLERIIGEQKKAKQRRYDNYPTHPNDPFTAIGKTKDIAVALVNAILKAKEKP